MLYQIRRPAGLMTAAAAAYVGPGDIVGSATAWWGLRAYSAATAGTKAINLRASGDNATSDFNTLTNGKLDIASINTFLTAHGGSLFATKLYDQTGNGNDLAQTTAASQPALTMNVLGTLPAIDATGVNAVMNSVTTLTQAQPFTISDVFNQVASSAANIMSSQDGGVSAVQLLQNFDGADTITIYAGTDYFVACTHNAWHAHQGIWNAASSLNIVDGIIPSPSNLGGNGFSVMHFGILSDTPAARFLSGYLGEIGLWGFGFTNTQVTNMNSNQHTYWGF